MREVSKQTPKHGGDGPPSSIKGMKSGKGHKQTGKKGESASRDMSDQRMQQGKQIDPFQEMMKSASRNSRYALPFEIQGTASPNDPTNATPDEIDNMPKKSARRFG